MEFKKGDRVDIGDGIVGIVVGKCKKKFDSGYLVQMLDGAGNPYTQYRGMLYKKYELSEAESNGNLYWWFWDDNLTLTTKHLPIKTKFLEGFQL